MPAYELYRKVVVDITTTLPEATLRGQLNALEASLRAEIISTAAADPDLTLVLPMVYALKVFPRPSGEFEIRPKLIFTIDSPLTEDQVYAKFDGFPAAFQGIFRGIVSAPQTTIRSWHLHFSTGDVDEVEP